MSTRIVPLSKFKANESFYLKKIENQTCLPEQIEPAKDLNRLGIRSRNTRQMSTKNDASFARSLTKGLVQPTGLINSNTTFAREPTCPRIVTSPIAKGLTQNNQRLDQPKAMARVSKLSMNSFSSAYQDSRENHYSKSRRRTDPFEEDTC